MEDQESKGMRTDSVRRLSEGLPSVFDWRDVMVMTSVKDGGYCGAGYAFSTIAHF